MIAFIVGVLILWCLIALLGHMSSSARRQRAMLDELSRTRREAEAKELAERGDPRNAWQKFFNWDI